MKSHFECKQASSSLSPSKHEAAKIQLKDHCTPKYEDEFCKSCLKGQQIQSLHSNLQITNIENVHSKTEDRSIHNKENEDMSPKLTDWDHEVQHLKCSELQEDSGYFSPQLNRESIYVSEQHSDLIICESPTGFSLESQALSQIEKESLLPVLCFEEVVCSTLKKSSKRNPKVYCNIIDKVILKKKFPHLIGKRMGLDRLDILGELFQRSFIHLLAKILRHLSDRDLINFARVSKTWKKIIEKDRWAFQMYSTALRSDLEARPSSVGTKEYVLRRTALASIQKAAVPVPGSSKKSTKTSNHLKEDIAPRSRHAEFTEIAKTLKNDESLKVCSHCGSPAKFDSYLQRAVCGRESCGFDFCTRCLCDYHFSRGCTSTQLSKSGTKLGPLPGSRKSKQNLRRL
ncbi:F-box only protein 5 [Microcaecilia unicolor]|uniref:F-box only protein 5 n=1 Tax=Microcaecilia unicolor TaxID=1415580 RepID=A0A6P7XFX5_9AMPH|nr:F-box only protein 5 [Microcaecilia unicolor]